MTTVVLPELSQSADVQFSQWSSFRDVTIQSSSQPTGGVRLTDTAKLEAAYGHSSAFNRPNVDEAHNQQQMLERSAGEGRSIEGAEALLRRLKDGLRRARDALIEVRRG